MAIIKHASRFSILRSAGTSTIYLRGERHSADTTAVFVIGTDVTHGTSDGKVHFIRRPCKRVATLSSIYTQVMHELGRLGSVVGIDNIDYVCNPVVREKFQQDKLPELARNPEPDLEQTIRLKPDVVFTFGMGDGVGPDPRLADAGIPAAVSVDHLESTPLARAEWIRFFAEFVDAAQMADSIFSGVERDYIRIKKMAQGKMPRPTVLTEVKYGDTWYMPGGRSYMARLLEDAGADYLWKEDMKSGSLPLSFEEVLSKARDAGYWLNLSAMRSRDDLLKAEPRYGAFRACQLGNLYNNTKNSNENGYSPYWESGMIHPERILSDLVRIFHPSPQVNDSLYFYYEKLR